MLSRRMYRLLLVMLLATVIPIPRPATAGAGAAAPDAAGVPEAHGAPPHALPPLQATPRPQLTLDLQIAPDPLTLTDTATLTATVSNGGDAAADDLAVRIPIPKGVQAVTGPVATKGADAWEWPLGSLARHATTTVTTTFQLTKLPGKRAVVFRAKVRARDVPRPLIFTRGALTVAAAQAPNRATFTPGTPLTFRTNDGQVELHVPKQAKQRRLTFTYTPRDASRRATDAVVGFTRGLGQFALTATDDQGQDVPQFDAPLTLRVQYTQDELDARGIAAADLTVFSFDTTTQQWTPVPTRVDPLQQLAIAQVMQAPRLPSAMDHHHRKPICRPSRGFRRTCTPGQHPTNSRLTCQLGRLV